VLVNLVANSRDAMEAGGRLTIEVAERVLDAAYARARPEVAMAVGRYAALMVTDTGIGMDRATLARVFEPFYTTKAVGEGTGLGLATVYGIVKQSGGYVWMYSEPGMGTTVKVYLPLTGPPQRSPVARDSLPARGGRETILVVEDEPMVRELARQSLEQLGYSVLEADSGDAALAIIERRRPAVDLILSDVVMPGLSARALAEAVARLDPSVPLLYMSGYPGDEVVRRGLLSPGAPLIQKPFSEEELDRSIRGLLVRARAGG
jgi:CheY-like chemotaxis protein